MYMNVVVVLCIGLHAGNQNRMSKDRKPERGYLRSNELDPYIDPTLHM